MITKYLSITVCVPTTVYSGPKSKDLLNMRKINGFMISNGRVKVKISEIRATISITHADDFTKYFSDIDLYLSAQSVKSFQLFILCYLTKCWNFLFHFLWSCFRTFNNLLAKTGELFEFVWPFCGLAPKRLTFIALLSQLLLSVF